MEMDNIDRLGKQLDNTEKIIDIKHLLSFGPKQLKTSSGEGKQR